MKGRSEEGFILIAALWMLAALAALTSAYAVYAMQTAPSAALPEQRLRAEAALRAGVELCAYRQLAWPKGARPDAGAFSTEVGAARVDVAYVSESARVDLNQSPHEVLAGLFHALGAKPAAAAALADRVVAWRGKLAESARQQEAAIYAKAGLRYRPPGAGFDNPLDLALLPGMTQALAARAAPYVTVFGADTVDPLVADPLVLAALPGATPAVVDALLAARNGPPPNAATLERIAGTLKDFVAVAPNEHVRAQIVATIDGRRIHAEVVLDMPDGGPAPYQILYWRDDFDGG